jgi:hypothetical protein
VSVQIEKTPEAQCITLSGDMKRWTYPLPLTGFLGVLTSFYLAVLGRMTWLTRLLDSFLRKKYIVYTPKSRVKWQRTIKICDALVEVEDVVRSITPIERYDIDSLLFPAQVNTNRYWAELARDTAYTIRMEPDRRSLSVKRSFHF